MEKRSASPIAVVLGLAAIAIVVLLGLFIYLRELRPAIETDPSATYHAIFLTNGQMFFGRINAVGKQNIKLGEVFYIQSRLNPQTKETTNILVLRGKEWHRPNRMTINMQHVLWIEPVGAESDVAKLIAKLRSQN